jgi:hypothetical protein
LNISSTKLNGEKFQRARKYNFLNVIPKKAHSRMLSALMLAAYQLHLLRFRFSSFIFGKRGKTVLGKNISDRNTRLVYPAGDVYSSFFAFRAVYIENSAQSIWHLFWKTPETCVFCLLSFSQVSKNMI